MALTLALLLGVSIIIMFIGLDMSAQPSAVETRLQQYGTRPRTLREMELQQPFGERVIQPVIRGMAAFIARFAPQRNVEELRHKLDLAGNPNNWTTSDFLGVRGLAAMMTMAVFTLPLFLLRAGSPQFLFFLAVGGILGFYLPLFWLNLKIRSRQHEMLRELPDALDLLMISVEAGLGFDAAMTKVAEKADNELSRAFGRVNAEIRLGKLRRDAL